MRRLIRRHTISFINAFAGIWIALKNQPNFIIHIIAGSLAFVLAYYLRITTLEKIIILFTIVLVLIAEMVNTSIESMTDLITTEWRQSAKTAKDVSAGMTLVAAIGSLIVGYVIFVPRIMTLFSGK